jgi:hypothetical protein
MKPKLRTIRTRRRATSVPRKDIRAAAKAVTAARDPEIDLIVRGLASPKKLAGATRK